jgi:hypothetical protein
LVFTAINFLISNIPACVHSAFAVEAYTRESSVSHYNAGSKLDNVPRHFFFRSKRTARDQMGSVYENRGSSSVEALTNSYCDDSFSLKSEFARIINEIARTQVHPPR